jgi:hypothetical protein
MKENNKYTIVDYVTSDGDNRFAIADNSGKIIDTANNYGYKTRQKAFKAANYKFGGGKERADKGKDEYKKWLNSDPKHKQVITSFNRYMESYFKDILIGDYTEDDVWELVINDYSIEIPDFVKKNKFNYELNK